MNVGDITSRLMADVSNWVNNLKLAGKTYDEFAIGVREKSKWIGDEFEKVNDKTKKLANESKKAASDFSGATTQMTQGIRSLASAFGVSLTIGGVVAFTRSVIDSASRLDDLSKQTGITTSTLSGLKSTLEENGTSLDAFARGMSMAQRQLGEIKTASDPAFKAIKDLGLNINELRAMDTEEFSRTMVQFIEKIEDPFKRLALGTALLNRNFRELWPAIEAAAKKWDELKRSGLSQSEIKLLDDVGDAYTRLWNKFLVWGSRAIWKAIENFKDAMHFFKTGQIVRPEEARPGAGEFGTE